MSNIRLRFYFKIIVFTILFFIACGFQTSFWPNITMLVPSPQFWLILIVFMTIKWSPSFTIFYIYFLGFCMLSFSEAPLKMIWLTLLIMFSLLLFIKNRIQLTGAISFIILVLIGSVIFEFSYYYFSTTFEVVPTSILFTDRVLQILINFIFSFPLYFVLNKFDTLIFDENEWKRSSTSLNEVQYE